MNCHTPRYGMETAARELAEASAYSQAAQEHAVACFALFPFLLLGGGWIAIAGMLIWLVYRTWRPDGG